MLVSAAERDRIAERHSHVLQRSRWQRFRAPILATGLVLYMIFAWWFFAIGHVIGNANWGLAGNYLADWVSYEIRPELNVDRDGAIHHLLFALRSDRPNPNPDWITTRKATITRKAEVPAAAPVAPAAPKPASSFNFMAPRRRPPATPETSAARLPQRARRGDRRRRYSSRPCDLHRADALTP